ncbi:MAG: PEGA domain-containing protein [Myxococcales bacterium]|nr:MAG: PEGA domain-containing protein [Myxococcales bacterium]
MIKWTSESWLKPCAIVVLTAFFWLYGVDLAVYAGLARAQAQSIDDLLDEDDSDLLGAPTTPTKPPEEEPAPPAEPEAKQPPAEEPEEEEAAPAEKPAEPKAEAEPEQDEEKEPAPPAEQERKRTPARQAVSMDRPRIDGPTSVVAVVFPANDKYKRRAVEQDLLIRAWFRGSQEFTYTPINYALGDRGGANEDAQAKKAQQALSDGIASYNNVQLDEAIESLEEAVDLYGPLMDYPEYRSRAEDAMIHLAAAYVLNGEAKSGQDIFTRLLQSKPNLSIKDKGFPPGVEETFDKAKSELADAPSASLNLSSKPSKMAVFMDGHFRGLTPIKLDNLAVGGHYLKVSEPAYQEYASKVTLYKGMAKKIGADLKQVRKYYQYKSEADAVAARFEHKKMWDSAQNLGKALSTDNLFLCKVSEISGIVTMEAFHYNFSSERYKTQTVQIELAGENVDQATFAFLDRFFSEETEWQDTYIPPEEVVAAKADEVEAAPFWKTWWFWTVIGVVVAGGVTTGVLLGTDVLDSGGSDGDGDGPGFENPNAINVSF